jgi:RsiW-degrading membrane proteinase PrsW (M82 family)
MQTLSYLLLGFAPGLFWLWWFRRKDDLEPEPRMRLVKVFVLGAAATLLVLALHPFLAPRLAELQGRRRDFVETFVHVALVEEAAKLFAFLLGVWWSREFDEPLDGILYGIAAGLGFASLENVLYLIRTDDPSLIVGRSFTATLAHVMCSGSLGFFFGVARFRRGGNRALLFAMGIVIAVLLHGLYDLLLGYGKLAYVALLVLLPLGLQLLGLKIRWARARSPEYHPGLAEGGAPVTSRRRRRRRRRE